MVVNVPFGFHVGNVALPAGEYSVDMRKAPGFVWVISADGKAVAIVPSFGKEALKYNDQGNLIFNRYGDNYFLSQVWTRGGTGREINTSRREREMASNAGQPARESLLAKATR
jgi:hypothetical protein